MRGCVGRGNRWMKRPVLLSANSAKSVVPVVLLRWIAREISACPSTAPACIVPGAVLMVMFIPGSIGRAIAYHYDRGARRSVSTINRDYLHLLLQRRLQRLF